MTGTQPTFPLGSSGLAGSWSQASVRPWPVCQPRPCWEEALGWSQAGDHGWGWLSGTFSQRPVSGHPHPPTFWSVLNNSPSIGSQTFQRVAQSAEGSRASQVWAAAGGNLHFEQVARCRALWAPQPRLLKPGSRRTRMFTQRKSGCYLGNVLCGAGTVVVLSSHRLRSP